MGVTRNIGKSLSPRIAELAPGLTTSFDRVVGAFAIEFSLHLGQRGKGGE